MRLERRRQRRGGEIGLPPSRSSATHEVEPGLRNRSVSPPRQQGKTASDCMVRLCFPSLARRSHKSSINTSRLSLTHLGEIQHHNHLWCENSLGCRRNRTCSSSC